MQEFEEDIREGSYELLYILSGNLTESETVSIVESVKKLLFSQDARIEYEESWGKQRLAYAVKHLHHGYYFLIQFIAPKGKIEPLNHEFRMRPEILRSQIISIVLPTAGEREKSREARAKRLKELMEEEKQVLKKEESIVRPYDREDRKEKKIVLKDTEEPLPQAPSREALASQKTVNLEELDKKLDALLEDDGMQNIL